MVFHLHKSRQNFNGIKEKVQKYTFTASIIAQLVKNPSAMQETLVRLLIQEDLLEKG